MCKSQIFLRMGECLQSQTTPSRSKKPQIIFILITRKGMLFRHLSSTSLLLSTQRIWLFASSSFPSKDPLMLNSVTFQLILRLESSIRPLLMEQMFQTLRFLILLLTFQIMGFNLPLVALLLSRFLAL